MKRKKTKKSVFTWESVRCLLCTYYCTLLTLCLNRISDNCLQTGESVTSYDGNVEVCSSLWKFSITSLLSTDFVLQVTSCCLYWNQYVCFIYLWNYFTDLMLPCAKWFALFINFPQLLNGADFKSFSGNFFYRKLTIGTTITAIEANNDTYCLQKRIEKFPLECIF